MSSRVFIVFLAAVLAAQPASAATVQGVVTDASGAQIAGARVVLRDVAIGREIIGVTGADGRYKIEQPAPGTYLLTVSHAGFEKAAKTIVIENAEQAVTASLELQLGVHRDGVTVTAARAEREIRQIPLHVETLAGAEVKQTNPLSTGDALTMLSNITPVGGGPFGVRPRLRGLDSTRLLVLVDGERLNTARQATDRTGAEVGLIATDAISRLEVVNGAGTILYGSDALSGTINIITNEPKFSSSSRVLYGFNGFYSSNEDGRRGTVTLGYTSTGVAIRVQAGAERYDNYRAGDLTVEDTQPFFTSGALRRADTVDDAFGFSFGAFPDPFNAPFVRTSAEVPNSQADGSFVNASALVAMGERRTLRVRYQSRRMNDIGFPDFADPFFFNATSLPHSNFDRISARYEARALTPWLANLTLSAYFQRTERLLRNVLPVQFPVPTPVTFFPISVMRLDILSETEQRVRTPGIDLQATIIPASHHLLTAGLTTYQDRSSDLRTRTTSASQVGRVALGPFGPGATVFPTPTPLGPPVVDHPVRVPDASLRDIGLYLQDEWRIRPNVSVVAGVRADFYSVTTEATAGYDVASVVEGANPPIDPATLPDPNGVSFSRSAMTGDVGVIANPGGRVSPFVRIGRSYRHPNLEEMLFSGPATIGSIAPNVLVKPEIGTNFDAGATFRAGVVSGGAFVFVNRYQDFIAQDLVVAVTPEGPLAQATNFADTRISGVELSATAPLLFRYGAVTLSGAAAFTRGTVTEGVNPLDGSALDGTPMDNITPAKAVFSARFTDRRSRWWVEYGARTQAEVRRIATTLLDSPFIIAQDLLSLDGFTIHRLGWGLRLVPDRDRVNLTFAVENLANTFYREQFQFAPARGRSVTVGVTIGADREY